jgi:hypothetical protein
MEKTVSFDKENWQFYLLELMQTIIRKELNDVILTAKM